MNRLKKILCEFQLTNTKNAFKKNTQKIRLYLKNKFPPLNDCLDYKRIYLEQLRLLSRKSYLENKLSAI